MSERFAVAVADAVLSDLRSRLRDTRFPLGVTDHGGVPLEDARDLLDYWRDGFDWRARERAMNELPHYRTDVAGVRLHYIHARSSVGDATPLLLLHGWPGSFVEMLDVIPLLSQPFHIVVPSLPGYGFSDAPTAAGWSNARMADAMAELMTTLGYDRFLVQGGDWGAGIGTWLARRHQSKVRGLHLNYIPGSFAPDVEPGDRTPEEDAFLASCVEWADASGAYGHVQRTRPLTLGYALSDSPAGLAAWIWEKFREWADPAGLIDRDAILSNITVYWATNTIASSMRLYLEAARTPLRFERGERLAAPCAIFRCPHEAPFPPRSWIERVYDVRRWTDLPRGGHFAAMEVPGMLAADLTAFAADLR